MTENAESGNIKKDLKLSDRVYRCECGNMIDRDFQASINLKTYGEKFASWHWNVNYKWANLKNCTIKSSVCGQ